MVNELAESSSPKPIFVTANFYPKRIAEQIAADAGAKSYHIPSNVGDSGIESYSELFDYIIKEITH